MNIELETSNRGRPTLLYQGSKAQQHIGFAAIIVKLSVQV